MRKLVLCLMLTLAAAFTLQSAIAQDTNPLPTLFPPTPLFDATLVPGRPFLFTRNFTSEPSTIAPGDIVRLTFDILNQGTGSAKSIVILVDSGSGFAPANGQASISLTQIDPNASGIASLAIVTRRDLPNGYTAVPITISYQDSQGQVYSTSTTLSVQIQSAPTFAEVVLSQYTLSPTVANPGDPTTVTLALTNSGSAPATQILLHVASSNNVLMAGSKGDNFPAGDLAPNATENLEVPLVIKSDAASGLQAQPITISYFDNGVAKQYEGTITIPVAAIHKGSATLLLDSYSAGADSLAPGEQFTFTGTLHNVGEGAASDVLATFGTVTVSSGSDNAAQTNTTASNVFAPIGTGGTLYIGQINAQSTTTLTQEFAVNGNVTSGIYSLPITLQYTKQDGTVTQDSLFASLIVVIPPNLEVISQDGLPPESNVGDVLPLSIQLTNKGTNDVKLTTATVEVANGDVVSGQESYIGVLSPDNDTTVDTIISPRNTGVVTVTVTIQYLDDLNRVQSIIKTYTTQAGIPPTPTPDLSTPPPPVPSSTPIPSANDLLGQFLRGLLGLGS